MAYKPTSKDRDQALAFDIFSDDQGGTYPPGLAAHFLRLSVQGLTSAANRGRIRFTTWRGVRHYGKKSVLEYRRYYSRKFETM